MEKIGGAHALAIAILEAKQLEKVALQCCARRWRLPRLALIGYRGVQLLD